MSAVPRDIIALVMFAFAPVAALAGLVRSVAVTEDSFVNTFRVPVPLLVPGTTVGPDANNW